MEEIEEKAESGKTSLRGLSEEDMASILDEFSLMPSLAPDELGLKGKKEVETEVIIGEGRDVRFPLLLRHPIFVDANPIVYVNKSVRIASAYGAILTKNAINTGEGVLPEERKIAQKFQGDLIIQWSAFRMGIEKETIEKAKAIIIDISGEYNKFYPTGLLWDKVQGKDGLIGAEALGPRHHLDIEDADDLKSHVEFLRDATEYNIPIMIKISSSNVYDYMKSAIEADADAVIINTSTNPFCTLSSISGTYGAALVGSIPPALKAIKTTGAKKKGVKLLVSGGVRNGSDIVKILAMNVDAVGISEASIIALGCNLCGECYAGKCEKGITTRIADLKSRFNWKIAGKKLANYLKATNHEIELLMDYLGVANVKELSGKNLTALTYDAAAISGVKLVGYDKELPMWFH